MQRLTPRGSGGVAVVRVLPHERDRVLAALRGAGGGPVRTAAGAPPRLCSLLLDGEPIDEVLLVDRGARGLELHLHGSEAVLTALATTFGPLDEPAPGPAAALLAAAQDPAQVALALEQQRDFAVFVQQLAALPEVARRREVAAALARSRVALAHVEPQRVVLIGRQNAGKSTLFNRLLLHERALVGALPGLTRDPVREVTPLQGYPYELVDTAGEGPAAAAVDADALSLARRERREALCVLVVDAHRGPDRVDRELLAEAVVVVASKCDLPAGPWPADFPRHLASGTGADEPGPRLGGLLRHSRKLPPAGPVGGPAALSRTELAALTALA